MRLLIFTNRDLASNFMLNLLLPKIQPGFVRGIFVSDKVGKTAAAPPPRELQLLKFFEQTLPNEFLFPQLDALNRPPADGRLMTFTELSRHCGIPLASLNDVKSPESLSRISALRPDLVLSIRYGKIFGSEFLKIPPLGVLNLHSGRLPQYRGILAVMRALMNGDPEINPTLHYIEDAGIDTGGIVGFASLKAEPGRSLLWHILQIYPASLDLVAGAVEQIASGRKPAVQAQEEGNSAYFTFPTQAEIEVFQQKGWQVTDPGEQADFMKRYL